MDPTELRMALNKKLDDNLTTDEALIIRNAAWSWWSWLGEEDDDGED